ncbi:MAG: hypothetical protein ACJAXY_001012 [Nonlabens sp.]|jgi:hypothetical protein
MKYLSVFGNLLGRFVFNYRQVFEQEEKISTQIIDKYSVVFL